MEQRNDFTAVATEKQSMSGEATRKAQLERA
jgi:hypothetical protein